MSIEKKILTQKLSNFLFYLLLPLSIIFAYEIYISNSNNIFAALNTANNTYTNLLINKIINYPTTILPLFYFFIIQTFLHILFIGYNYVLYKNIILIFKLDRIKNNKNNYILYFIILFLSYIAILTINSINYPNSKFYINNLNNKYAFLSSICYLYGSLILNFIFLIKKIFRTKLSLFIVLFTTLIVILLLNSKNNIYNNIYNHHHNNKNTQKPNVILITIDSFRSDYINKIYPINNNYLDIPSFINNSIYYNNAYTPLARSFPALYSMLSGHYPKEDNIRFNLVQQDHLNFNQLLPNILKQHGYDTFYSTDSNQFHIINKNWGYNILATPTQGIYEQILPNINDYPLSNLIINKYISNFIFPYTYSNSAAKNIYDPKTYLTKIKKYLLKLDYDKPLFLHFNFEAAHWPYLNKYLSDKVFFQQRYLNCLNTVNWQINQLFTYLSENNLLNNTLVILASDHGEALSISNDKLTNINNYTGKNSYLKLISKSPINYTFDELNKLNIKNYADHILDINTSGGHGVDVLSDSQYKVVLATQFYYQENNQQKTKYKARQLDNLVIINDIYPTVLDSLDINYDKENLFSLPGLSNNSNNTESNKNNKLRNIFLETGLQVPYFESTELENKDILQKFINTWSKFYHINNNLYLELLSTSVEDLKATKQYAIVNQDYLLAYIPSGLKQQWGIIKNSSFEQVKASNKCTIPRRITNENQETIAILCNNYENSPGYYIFYNKSDKTWQLYKNSKEFQENKSINNMYQALKKNYNSEIKDFS